MVKRRKKGITKKDTGKGFNESPQEDNGQATFIKKPDC